MHEIIKSRNIWFIVSGILMATSIVFISLGGLKLGIDFTGGSLQEISFSPSRPSLETVTESLSQIELTGLRIQPAAENDYILRFESVDENKHQEVLTKLNELAATQEMTVTEQRFESIGPVIGSELQNKALQAIIIVLVFIVIYIAYAFRKVSKPVASWKYGLAAIVALVHDITIVTGVFAVMGYFWAVEIDILFVTALLTILGFSVHDTIVVFDRTRENLHKHQNQQFDEVVNISVNETIVRSINTSLTAILTLLAVYFFGGQSISNFVLALIIGLIIGTYSSIYIASPLLVVWYKLSK